MSTEKNTALTAENKDTIASQAAAKTRKTLA